VLPQTQSEIENLRVRVTVREERIRPRPPGLAGPAPVPRAWQGVFGEAGPVDCALWRLPGGTRPSHAVPGPAVIVGAGSTAVIHPGQVGSFDPFGNLVVRDHIVPDSEEVVRT
jgi:hypothetical protein